MKVIIVVHVLYSTLQPLITTQLENGLYMSMNYCTPKKEEVIKNLKSRNW